MHFCFFACKHVLFGFACLFSSFLSGTHTCQFHIFSCLICTHCTSLLAGILAILLAWIPAFCLLHILHVSCKDLDNSCTCLILVFLVGCILSVWMLVWLLSCFLASLLFASCLLACSVTCLHSCFLLGSIFLAFLIGCILSTRLLALLLLQPFLIFACLLCPSVTCK